MRIIRTGPKRTRFAEAMDGATAGALMSEWLGEHIVDGCC